MVEWSRVRLRSERWRRGSEMEWLEMASIDEMEAEVVPGNGAGVNGVGSQTWGTVVEAGVAVGAPDG